MRLPTAAPGSPRLLTHPITVSDNQRVSPKRLATLIRTRRATLGLTQEQLAKRARIGQAYLAMLESGQRKSPSLPVLKRLAKALDVDAGALLG